MDESSTFGYLQRRTVRSNVHMRLHLKVDICMELVHTCTIYGQMQLHSKDMHEKNNSLLTILFMESQSNGLAKFGSRQLMYMPNLDLESHSMTVTCIIKLIILHAAHNIFHISYHVDHIILSYSMRPWDHRLDVRTSKNEGAPLGILLQQTQGLLHSIIGISCFILQYTTAITSHTWDVV